MFATRAQLHHAFTLLGEALRRREVHATVGIVGGAAMLLAYDEERAATSDVDVALADPHGPVDDAVAEVADALGLPRSWLNDQATMYAPPEPTWSSLRSFDHPHLRIMVLAADQMLAMKVLSGRPRDVDDIVTLLRTPDLATVDDVVALVATIFPGDELGPRQRQVLTEAVLRRGQQP